MSLRSWSARCTFWLVAAALLLKAAVPLLATAAAQVQGRALVEICTVYGVQTIALDEQGRTPGNEAPGHDDGVRHDGGHCLLGGVPALAAPASVGVPGAPLLPGEQPLLLRRTPPHAPDGALRWVARLKHGPPALA